MIDKQLLTIFLDDHLATLVGAIEVARRHRESNAANRYGDAAEAILSELLREERDLREVMSALEISPSRMKNAAAWVAEKLGRLKLNGRVTDYSALSRVVELEAVSGALLLTQHLWTTLVQLARHDARLDEEHLRSLAERTRETMKEVRSLHDDAALLAFEHGAEAGVGP